METNVQIIDEFQEHYRMSSIQIEPQINQLPPPPPPPQSKPAASNCVNAERRRRALAVDKFSRVGFPLSFTLLNILYWIIFAKYL
jgi:hypothetical protein